MNKTIPFDVAYYPHSVFLKEDGTIILYVKFNAYSRYKFTSSGELIEQTHDLLRIYEDGEEEYYWLDYVNDPSIIYRISSKYDENALKINLESFNNWINNNSFDYLDVSMDNINLLSTVNDF